MVNLNYQHRSKIALEMGLWACLKELSWSVSLRWEALPLRWHCSPGWNPRLCWKRKWDWVHMLIYLFLDCGCNMISYLKPLQSCISLHNGLEPQSVSQINPFSFMLLPSGEFSKQQEKEPEHNHFLCFTDEETKMWAIPHTRSYPGLHYRLSGPGL